MSRLDHSFSRLLAAVALAGLLAAGCGKKDSTAAGGGKSAEPPVGWSLKDVDLGKVDRTVGPTDGPARVYVGGQPTLFQHGEGDQDAYRRISDRLQRRTNHVTHYWAWEDSGRVYAVTRDTARTMTATPPPDLAKFQGDAFLATAEGDGMQVVSKAAVTHRGWSGTEAVLDGRGLRIVARVVVIPETQRLYVAQVSAVKQSDPIDADDPKVRAFLDNFEPIGGKEKK